MMSSDAARRPLEQQQERSVLVASYVVRDATEGLIPVRAETLAQAWPDAGGIEALDTLLLPETDGNG